MNLAPRLARRTPFFYGWIVLGSASSTQIVRNAAASLTIAVFMFPLAEDLGWSRTLIAGAASFGGLAASGASPIVGWLIDRYGARLVLAVSVFILGLSTISLAWATVPIAFYLAYGIGRVIFSSPVQIGASVVATRWFVRMRGRASGILFLSHSFGMIAFPLIASIVIDRRGWPDAWIVLGLIVWAVALLPSTLLIAERPEDVGLKPDGDEVEEEEEVSSGPMDEEPGWTLKAAMKTPALWILASGNRTAVPDAGWNQHASRSVPARRGTESGIRRSRRWAQRRIPGTRQRRVGLDCRARSRPSRPDHGWRGHDGRGGALYDNELNDSGPAVLSVLRVRTRRDALGARRSPMPTTTGVARWERSEESLSR